MTEETTTETTDVPADTGPDDAEQADESSTDETEPDTFPRHVVEELRKENGRYRKRAGQADELAQRLHTELVRATGRLADPSDLPFLEENIDDPDKLDAAIDVLLEAKPHLATRKPAGDIGQGNRGGAPQPVSLLQMLRERA
ncbi:MAG: hypothetical protein U0Q20_14310 [Mycobacterium sp.]